MSLVSLIIPTFNRGDFIGATLDSIIAQTYTRWECIVVDDGSSDYTKELMEFYLDKDERISFYQRPPELKKGPNSCRNFGFSMSKGKFINWFDSDDILLPEALEKRVGGLGVSYDLTVCDLQFIDEYNRHIDWTHRFLPSENIVQDYFLGNITFYTFTPMWSRQFLEKQEELFDENLSNLDDWDFNLRMIHQKPKIKYLSEKLILYRLHPNSLSREIHKLNFKELKSEFLARKKNLRLLKNDKNINLEILRRYDKERCKKKVRAALAVNHPKKMSLFRMLAYRQLALGDYKEFLVTTFGFLTVSLFGKGDRLFR